MRNLTLFVLTLFVLSACGPAAKLRRAQRLENEAIAAGAKVRVDTVFTDVFHPGEKTTVYLPGAERIRDTTVYQDKIKIQYIHHHDTVKVHVECPPDTIRVPITVHKSIICPDCPKDRFFKGVGYGAGGLLILLIILGLVRLIKP
jgi:hypothetical protein